MGPDATEFARALRDVALAYGDDESISEAELINRWFQAGVFSALGYGTERSDYRIEKSLATGRADLVLRAFGQRARAVLEFKRPKTPLTGHVAQLSDYAKQLQPDCAILTNGRYVWLYEQEGRSGFSPLARHFDALAVGPQDATLLTNRMARSHLDIRSEAAIAESIDAAAARPIRVQGPETPGGEAFLERFSLDGRSVFGRLVTELHRVLPQMRASSQFTAGAYSFWDRAYSRDLTVAQAPKTWAALLGSQLGQSDLRRFMFALESAYALLARTLLAKAMQDAGFPSMDVSAALRRSVVQHANNGRVQPKEYFDVAGDLLAYAGRQAFQPLFASDLFDWWTDSAKLDDCLPLAEALAESLVAIASFDFQDLTGDVLGDLYQSYFDPETRLALGEFYTPPEVVEFILDEVGYIGHATRTRRLLDPACGSGTFLVGALRRYLDSHADQEPRRLLSHLLGGMWIVGFDINPFATLLAQVNYAAQLLPLYAKALQAGDLHLSGLPVFRTDSLRHEKREAETDIQPPTASKAKPKPASRGLAFTYSSDSAQIRERLPVREPNGGFVQVVVPVPRADRALERQFVANLEEYALAISALFETVDAGDGSDGLERRLSGLGLPAAVQLAKFMESSRLEIHETLTRLRTAYDDGRFLKTLRDLAVALIVKNELRFHYVVGNPPYVRIQRIPEELRAYWQDTYDWPTGNFDIYVPFIERALTEWLDPGGKLGFICPSRFMFQDYGRLLRERLPQVAAVQILADYREAQVFRDAMNYVVVLVAVVGGSSDQQPMGARVQVGVPPRPTSALRSAIEQARASGAYAASDTADAFPLDIQQLAADHWIAPPMAELDLLNQIAAAGTSPLAAYTSSQSGGFAGYQTSADDVMVLREVGRRDGNLLLRTRDDEGPFEIESGALRPWLFGRDVKRWLVDWDGWWVIFPYVPVGGTYRLIPSKEHAEYFDYAGTVPFIEDVWPNLWAYLNRARVRDSLIRRENNKWTKASLRHRWYEAAYARSLPLYERSKAVVQMAARNASIAIDQAGHVFQAGGRGGGVYGLVFDDTDETSVNFVVGLLNSRVLDFYLKHVSTVYRGGFYSYSDAFLKNLPIPEPARDDVLRRRIAATSAALSEQTARERTIGERISRFPLPQIESVDASAERFPLHRLAEGSLGQQVFSKRSAQWRTRLDGKPALVIGRSTLVLPSESEADIVRAWLERQPNDSIRSARLMDIPIPAGSIAALVTGSLVDDESALARVRQDIRNEESSLNDDVLSLYGLDATARGVIENFLVRF